MGACLVEAAQLSVPGSEHYETGGQDAAAHWVAPGLDQSCSHHGHPELTHVVAHRRTWAHAREKLIVGSAQHGLTPSDRDMRRPEKAWRTGPFAAPCNAASTTSAKRISGIDRVEQREEHQGPHRERPETTEQNTSPAQAVRDRAGFGQCLPEPAQPGEPPGASVSVTG